jgi:hypothetical protein
MGGARRFVPIREVVHNQLLRVPALQRRARRHHTTGVLRDEQLAQEVFDHFAELLPVSVEAGDVLELGPGRGTGLMRAAQRAGVGSYAAVDVAGCVVRRGVIGERARARARPRVAAGRGGWPSSPGRASRWWRCTSGESPPIQPSSGPSPTWRT